MSTGRRPLVAGNWKLHKTVAESRELATAVTGGAKELVAEGACSVGLFPTALSLAAVAEVVASSGVEALVGAQNMYFEESGAFTGENSASLIQGAGGNSVILGHSERRHVFGETDELIGKKVAAAIAAHITPIFCVGELLEDRDAGRTTDVVGTQLQAGLSGLENAESLSRVIIAYEPVWAIGTGRTATPDQAQEVHDFVRKQLAGRFQELGGSADSSEQSLILYGGSVKPGNAADLVGQPDIDGALVGGASLDADSFLGICAACK
ncbi:MAG: triose-phosphate isomerase [Planctomycetota bacterium]